MARSRLKNSNENLEIMRHKQTQVSAYVKHVPLLILGTVFLFWTIRIVTTKYPSDIADTLLPNTYLPLLIPVFFSTTFLNGYFLLSIRRGVIVGGTIIVLLFLKLQNVQFEIGWLLAFTFLVTISFLLTKKNLL